MENQIFDDSHVISAKPYFIVSDNWFTEKCFMLSTSLSSQEKKDFAVNHFSSFKHRSFSSIKHHSNFKKTRQRSIQNTYIQFFTHISLLRKQIYRLVFYPCFQPWDRMAKDPNMEGAKLEGILRGMAGAPCERFGTSQEAFSNLQTGSYSSRTLLTLWGTINIWTKQHGMELQHEQ